MVRWWLVILILSRLASGETELPERERDADLGAHSGNTRAAPLGVDGNCYSIRKVLIVATVTGLPLGLGLGYLSLPSKPKPPPTAQRGGAPLPDAKLQATPSEPETELTEDEKTIAIARAIKNGLTHLDTTGDVLPFYRALSTNVDAKEAKRGKKPIGLGIDLDIAKIESLLTPGELALVREPKGRELYVAMMLSAKLHGDNDDEEVGERIANGKLRPASEFFEGQSKKRGVCRDKALILHSLLTHYGIDSKLAAGWMSQASEKEIAGNHVWVELPKQRAVLDPTNRRDGALEMKAYREMGLIYRIDDQGRAISDRGDTDAAHTFDRNRTARLRKMLEVKIPEKTSK